METSKPRRFRISFSTALAVLLVSVAGVGIVRARQISQLHDESANFAIKYGKPNPDWVAIPHGPQTIFLFQNKKDHALLRGAVNQIIADFNPTPDLKTEAIADFYIDRTHENMPNWTATKLDKVEAKGTAFRLISRSSSDKRVVTAYAVKGNTTLMVSMSGNGKESAAVEKELDSLRDFLKTVELVETDMSSL